MSHRLVFLVAAMLLVAAFGLFATGSAAAAATQNHTITAIVTDSTGAALSNVKIEISNTTTSSVGTTVTTYFGHTNSSGVYVSQPLNAGNYTVSASYEGYASNGIRNVALLSSNLTVNFTMTQLKGNLTGFVTTGKIPVANATLVLNDTRVSFRTNSSPPLGLYVFAGIPNGTYLLSAGKSGYVSYRTNVTIAAGSMVWQNLTLKPTLGILTGTVNSTTQNGPDSPLAGVNVTLQGTQGTLHTTTNAQGMYYFTNLSQGTYTVSVQSSGYTPGQTTVTVSLAKTSYLNFTLIPLTRNSPFTIPGFIGNFDLDHSLVIVALIIVMTVVTGSLTLLNKSYNWKEDRSANEDEHEDDGKNTRR